MSLQVSLKPISKAQVCWISHLCGFFFGNLNCCLWALFRLWSQCRPVILTSVSALVLSGLRLKKSFMVSRLMSAILPHSRRHLQCFSVSKSRTKPGQRMLCKTDQWRALYYLEEPIVKLDRTLARATFLPRPLTRENGGYGTLTAKVTIKLCWMFWNAVIIMDDWQTCPRCKTTKYRNPKLKLLVNVCGHKLYVGDQECLSDLLHAYSLIWLLNTSYNAGSENLVAHQGNTHEFINCYRLSFLMSLVSQCIDM